MDTPRSAITDDMTVCIICQRPREQIHHIFRGINRDNSTKYGYLLPLCAEHHTGPAGIHSNKQMDLFYRRKAQDHFEQTHTREDFIRVFGRNYKEDIDI